MNDYPDLPEHPDAETLGAMVEGTLDADTTATLAAHLRTCNECLDAVAAANRALREEAATTAIKPWWARRSLSIAAATVLVLAGMAIFREVLRDEHSPIDALAASAPRDYRVVEARLTGFPWAALRTFRDGDSPLPATDPEVLAMAGAAGKALERAKANELSAADAQAAGLGQLLFRETDSAEAWLERATRLEPQSAHAWSDLAAAQLTRALTRKRPIDLPVALASAHRALQLDPRSPEARFNRALILEYLGLRQDAVKAWNDYLEVDASSPWAQEAKAHLQRLAVPHVQFKERVGAIVVAAAAGDQLAVERIVDHDRQGARAWYEVEGLGLWAEEVEAGQPARAETKLAAAEAVGEALRKLNGESLLSASVAAIRRAKGNTSQLRELAKAHRAYREGRLLYSRQDLRAAVSALGSAAASMKKLGTPMASVARFYEANVLLDQSRVAEARTSLDRLVTRGLTPALEAQVDALYGSCNLFAGRWQEAIASLTAARDTFGRLGEHSFVGSMEGKLAEAHELLGQREVAWRHRVVAFTTLSAHPMHDRLLSAISGAARAESQAQRWTAALALLDVELAHAQQSGKSLFVADVWRRRARVLGEMGDARAASDDLAEARAAMAVAPASELRTRLETETSLVEAGIRRTEEPRAAIALYDAAISHFEQAGHRVFLPQAFLDRARAYRRIGQLEKAVRDLDAGIAELEQQRRDTENAQLRLNLFDQQSDLFEEAVDVSFDRGDAGLALAYADRAHGRALLDGTDMASRGQHDVVREVRRTLKPNEVLLETMLVSDGIATIVITPSTVHIHRQKIPRDLLEERAISFRNGVVRREDSNDVKRRGAELFQTLIAPLRDEVAGADTLVIVGDRFLESLPWAALYDDARKLWLVEQFSVVVAPSAAVWVRQTAHVERLRSGGSFLVVSASGGGNTAPLPFSGDEARMIAALHPQARMLIGDSATIERFVSECTKADVVHFAGHARMTATGNPALILPSEELSNETIRGLRFSQTRLVVLAACGTAVGESARLEGMPSLARAFLAAGVPSVVGSLWPLEDAETAEITFRFHQSLRNGADAARALRDAQMALLHSAEPSLRHPAAWAGVEILGTSVRI